MIITPHFKYKELVHTDHTQFKQQNYEQGKAFIGNMRMLSYFYLEPIRARYGVPIDITSCFRCLDLNRFIKSKDSSQHPKCEAVDFRVRKTESKKVFDYIQLKECFKWGQLILYPDDNFIHLSFPTLEENMQVKIFENGKYTRL